LPIQQKKARSFASPSFGGFAVFECEGYDVQLNRPTREAPLWQPGYLSPFESRKDLLALRPGFAAGLPWSGAERTINTINTIMPFGRERRTV
jgi:hypothetical protein